MPGNPNPKQKIKPLYGDEPLAEKPLTFRVSRKADAFVRSLPNKTEWLRSVIEQAVEQKEAGKEEKASNKSV